MMNLRHGAGGLRARFFGRLAACFLLLAFFGLLSGCASTGKDAAPTSGNAEVADAVPKVEPKSKYGNPKSYVVFGKRYYTKASSKGHVEKGLASWYGEEFQGRPTSSGEPFDMYEMTAAHRTLPIPTYVRVTNLENGQSVVVRVNDRGPFSNPDERILDVSYAAAVRLGMVRSGTTSVRVEALEPWQYRVR